jgi:hypothetical protein
LKETLFGIVPVAQGDLQEGGAGQAKVGHPFDQGKAAAGGLVVGSRIGGLVTALVATAEDTLPSVRARSRVWQS